MEQHRVLTLLHLIFNISVKKKTTFLNIFLFRQIFKLIFLIFWISFFPGRAEVLTDRSLHRTSIVWGCVQISNIKYQIWSVIVCLVHYIFSNIFSGGFCFIHAVFWRRGKRDHNRWAGEGSLVLCFSKTEKTRSTYISVSDVFC